MSDAALKEKSCHVVLQLRYSQSGLQWPPVFSSKFEAMMCEVGMSRREGEILHHTEHCDPCEEILCADVFLDLSQATMFLNTLVLHQRFQYMRSVGRMMLICHSVSTGHFVQPLDTLDM